MDGFVQVDVRKVVTGLGKMSKAAKELGKPFRKFKPFLRADIDQHFSAKVEPDGAWPQWSQAYYDQMLHKPRMALKRAFAPKKPLLMPGGFTVRGARRFGQMLGRLDRLVHWSINHTTLTVESTVPWAPIHQWGGVAGRGAKIPQRMFLWASEKAISALVIILQEHVALAWWS